MVETTERAHEGTKNEENMEPTTEKISDPALDAEKKPDSDDKKMTADQINENIEKVLEITMPKHTKLLYGTEEGKRVERDPSAQEVRLI